MSTVLFRLNRMFFVNVGNLGCEDMWSSEIYLLCVILLTNFYSPFGTRKPKNGIAGIVKAILCFACKALYLYLIDRII